VLLGAGLIGAYWWLYKVAPARHLVDPEWLAAHSEEARWAEEQKDYRRRGTSPDLCFRGDRIGFYGGKDWFLWLDRQIRNPGEFRHCGCTEYALSLMTNQETVSWKEWADANRERSQEEWIRDGFVHYGVGVHLPPRPDDAVPLLRLLGRESWDFLWEGPQRGSAPKAVPSYVHYNAYRWLRDSGFEPLDFASSNPVLAAEPDISRGLFTFAQWRAAYPGRHGLGVLAFGRESEKRSHLDMRPALAKPWVAAGVDASLVAITIGGGLLVLLCIRKKKGTIDQASPPRI